MLVDRGSLNPLPEADELLQALAGEITQEAACGDVIVCNELALHVIELKLPRPEADLSAAHHRFQAAIRLLRQHIDSMGARLMPSATHPWMDPAKDTLIWPHQNSEIYQTFNRIFGCGSHGWTNLQSMHINLPFEDDRSFKHLHAAVRFILPLLPALAASSPWQSKNASGLLDNRLAAYANNCELVPEITGLLIPEPIGSRQEYTTTILEPIYRALRTHDPEGTLCHEWINARGAIARFFRNTIEIRVLDVQESPLMDMAIAWTTCQLASVFLREEAASTRQTNAFDTRELRGILDSTIRDAERAELPSTYTRLLTRDRVSGGPAWKTLAWIMENMLPAHPEFTTLIEFILSKGCLARRMLKAGGANPSQAQLKNVARSLCDCLETGTRFEP